MTYIIRNNSIDTMYELFIVLAIFLFSLILLCKIGNFISSLPVKEPKGKNKKVKQSKKEEKVEKEPAKEAKQEPATNTTADSTLANVNTPIIINQYPNSYDTYQNNGYNNYLYDRFVDAPTNEDNIQQSKISEAFMSDNELNAVKNTDIKIRVKEDSLDSKKSKLYNRINQMTTSNMETRERLLKEFEGLSKEMKLLLIDNIIQKL